MASGFDDVVMGSISVDIELVETCRATLCLPLDMLSVPGTDTGSTTAALLVAIAKAEDEWIG